MDEKKLRGSVARTPKRRWTARGDPPGRERVIKRLDRLVGECAPMYLEAGGPGSVDGIGVKLGNATTWPISAPNPPGPRAANDPARATRAPAARPE